MCRRIYIGAYICTIIHIYSICTNIIPLWWWDSRVFKLKKAERVGESSGVRSGVEMLIDHQTSTKAVGERGRGEKRRRGRKGTDMRRERECEG